MPFKFLWKFGDPTIVCKKGEWSVSVALPKGETLIAHLIDLDSADWIQSYWSKQGYVSCLILNPE